jgi:acyl phosphate:glycerol-3-phosphate acyltransferase
VDFLGYGLIAVAAYLLGSIPTGFLVAKIKGIDIRKVGSGNIGATNALRVLGKPAGITVLLVDALKGFIAVAAIVNWYPELYEIAPAIFGADSHPHAQTRAVLGIVAGVFAVLGHNYTCWLRFKGGKGIATSAGVLTALVPWSLLIILTVFIVLTFTTRYVSVGSVAASFTLPFATWFTTHNWTLTAVTGAMGVLAIFKHKGNIQRLINGTEPRIGRAKAATPAEAVK